MKCFARPTACFAQLLYDRLPSFSVVCKALQEGLPAQALLTCGDADTLADSVQGSSVSVADEVLQAVHMGPLLAHMLGRPEGRLPVDPGPPAQGGACQNVDACGVCHTNDSGDLEVFKLGLWACLMSR